MPKASEFEAVAPLKPAAPYQGGKRLLAARLVQRIAAVPHGIYAEPFVGMGGIFLRRRLRPRLEIINDLNREVANFFRVLQRHPEPLLNELAWALPGRREFERLRQAHPETLTDLERAARFYLLQRLAYGGKVRGRTFGVDFQSGRRMRLDRQLLLRIHSRLEGTLIECLPYQEFIPRYDRPETLFYLDPPYWGSEDAYGKAFFSKADFERLAQLLRRLNGRFLLSINDTPEIRTIFAGFALEEVETKYTIGNSDRAAKRGELVISGGGGKGRSRGP